MKENVSLKEKLLKMANQSSRPNTVEYSSFFKNHSKKGKFHEDYPMNLNFQHEEDLNEQDAAAPPTSSADPLGGLLGTPPANTNPATTPSTPSTPSTPTSTSTTGTTGSTTTVTPEQEKKDVEDVEEMKFGREITSVVEKEIDPIKNDINRLSGMIQPLEAQLKIVDRLEKKFDKILSIIEKDQNSGITVSPFFKEQPKGIQPQQHNPNFNTQPYYTYDQVRDSMY